MRSQRVEVLPSAVLELTWVLNRLHWHDRLPDIPALEAEADELRQELAVCWPDGLGCLPDTSILAERIGALLTDAADSFLRGLERAARLDGVGLELRSETPEVRAATIARLERLREDPSEVRRYGALLSRVWELIRPEWDGGGREEVLRACADWTRKLRQGAGPEDLLPSKHLVHRSDQEPLLAMRPRVVLSPLLFTTMGGFVIDMTRFLHLGGPARPMEDQETRRRESEVIASRMKVLSDGTRVALLRDLAQEPASVMDLARRFGLAQPTVSNHVRMLREAGLLESRKDGARILYTAPTERLDRVLSDTRHLLLEH
jgi:DNA-binding transcriptional ArsR family regulator